MKKALLVVIAVLLFTSGIAMGSSINGDYQGFPIVKVVVNGQEVKSDVPAIMLNGRTMVPLRVVSETLGAEVKWDDLSLTTTINLPQQLGPTIKDAKVLDIVEKVMANSKSRLSSPDIELRDFVKDREIIDSKIQGMAQDLDSIWKVINGYSLTPESYLTVAATNAWLLYEHALYINRSQAIDAGERKDLNGLSNVRSGAEALGNPAVGGFFARYQEFTQKKLTEKVKR